MSEMTVKEFAKLGGDTTKEKYGSDHFSRMGKKGRENILKKDPEYYQKLSQSGIAARKRKQIEKNQPVQPVSEVKEEKKSFFNLFSK